MTLPQVHHQPHPPLQRSSRSLAGRAFGSAGTRSRHRIELRIEDVVAGTGVRLRRVAVGDESADSPSRDGNQQVLAVLDDMLRAHPEWRSPCMVDGELVVQDNPVSEWLYRSAALREWRQALVPSAMALFPVQRAGSHLPSGAPMDPMTQMVLRDSLDAVGIRTRARIMADVVAQTAQRTQPVHSPQTGTRQSWVSLACGAAVPILEALEQSGMRGAVDLTLVDIDADALAFAAQLAAQEGLSECADLHVLRRDLVRGIIATDRLVEELGPGTARVVEALGIFEYFTDASAVKLLRNAYRLVAPGGVLIVGNMLLDRPQLAFNQRGAGWPRLYPRSPEQLVALVAAAGLPLDQTTVTIPADGVYAVVHVTR